MREVTDYALNRKAIRHYMVEHDMGQKQLAKMCGTSPVTLTAHAARTTSRSLQT